MGDTTLPVAVARWLGDADLVARIEAQSERLIVGPRMIVRHAVAAYVAALEADPGLSPLRDDPAQQEPIGGRNILAE